MTRVHIKMLGTLFITCFALNIACLESRHTNGRAFMLQSSTVTRLLPFKSVQSHNWIASEVEKRPKFSIKQVPGQGSCLFDAIALSLQTLENSYLRKYTNKTSEMSSRIRRESIAKLNSSSTLILDGNNTISSTVLLNMVADQYGLAPDEYCSLMLLPDSWGGGPEIVAISNILNRQICIYELKYNSGFWVKQCASFGSPSFNTSDPIRLLYTDGRFPSLAESDICSANYLPNHFLPLLITSHKAAVSDHFDDAYLCDLDDFPPSPRSNAITNSTKSLISRLRGWRAKKVARDNISGS